jgi:phospholipase/carboxylesterase
MGRRREAWLAVALCWLAGCGGGTEPMGPMTAWVERSVFARQRIDGRQPPLLVLLHGIGADENDLLPLAPRLDPRFTLVSLRAPQRYHQGYSWFHIEFRPDGTVVPDLAQAHDSLAALLGWLHAAPSRLATDPTRTFLLGFSQGAMMSLGVLRTEPERLAGVVALSGGPSEELFEPRASRAAIAAVPLLVAHGTLDDVLPVTQGRLTRDAFSTLSRDFTYREFPIGHAISEEEMRLVAAWLSQRL